MSGEMIAIVAVGVALAGVILTATRGLRQDMARLDERINGLDSRFDAIEKQFGELRERMAHLKGCWKDCARPSPDGRRPARCQNVPPKIPSRAGCGTSSRSSRPGRLRSSGCSA